MLGAALQSYALTIGRPNGSAWIGKPLDLSIPLELDRSESGDSLCLEADVLQGDARVDDKRVTLSLEPGAGPDAPRVRLRTTRAIEEPVVTVKLSAGCVTKSTRQYVLLADLPETPPVVASPSRLAAPVASSADGAALAPAAPPRPARVARPSGQASSQPAGRPAADVQDPGAQAALPPPRRRVTPVPVPAPAPKPEAVRKPRQQAPKVAASPAAPAAEPKSRLQIEALSPEQQSQLPKPALAARTAGSAAPAAVGAVGASTGAAAPGAGASGLASGSDAAGVSVAAAVAAATEQSRRDAERLKELETALATLREQSAQTQRQLLELRGSLAQAEAARYRNPVIYGLLALLLLALIGLVLLWRQARQARQAAAWWSGAAQEEGAAAPAKRALPRHGELADDDEEDEEDDTDEESAPADLSGLRSASQGLRVTALPAGVGASAFQRANVRPVNAEELFDVQQQSDFFNSLGQHEQAIGVLHEHIAANPGTSAMAYLDLLGLLQSLGRREGYAAVAREYGQGFNMDVPAFGQFSGGTHGIEHYPGTLQHIVDKWPSPGTAELIEQFVFRKPLAAEDCFELPAYQDLLLLYAVARDLIEYDGPWSAPAQISVKPLVAVPPGHAEHAYQETSPMPYLPASEVGLGRATADAPEEAPMEFDLADLDRTAFETLRAPIESQLPAAKPSDAPAIDPHVIDFDPFDPDTNAGDLRPRHLGVKR